MIKLHNQTLRTFFHSVAAAAVMTLGLALSGHGIWSAGFCIGALISLFSLFSLKVCIPILFHKGASRRSTALLHVILLMKMPVYAAGLYFATQMGNAAAFSAFVGCTLVPCVITVEAVCKAVSHANPRWLRALRFTLHRPAAVLPRAEESKAAGCESPALSAQVRTVHEGAA